VDKIASTNPTVEIFSQGEEVITGQVADTNAAWLSSQLIAMGFNVSRHTAVGDQLDALIKLLKEISRRADCCLCTGGLGPTTDDLTREAVATAFDAPLYFDETALKNIQAFFQQRGKVMAEVNRQQAFFPQGATKIDNLWGTAPAFSFKFQRCLFIFLPGVPYEMRHLFNEKIKLSLETYFSLKPQPLITIKTFGIGESELQVILNTLNLPDFVKIGFRATADEVQVKLLFNERVTIDDKEILIQQITDKIGDPVFAVDSLKNSVGNLVDVVSTILDENKQTLAMIETVSQGLFAAKCVGQLWLLNSSFCANLETLKQQWQLETEAGLSVIAKQLAEKLQQQSGADFALVQLYNDSNTFGNENHSRLLYNTLQTPQGVYQQIQTLNGSQKNQQNRAAMLGFDLLRRYLQQKKL